MTGNQIAYAALRETRRHNRNQEIIDRQRNQETQRHNVNNEIAQTRNLDIQDRYNRERIDLDKAKVNLSEYQINNNIDYNNNKLHLEDTEITRKIRADKTRAAQEQQKITLGYIKEVHSLADDLLDRLDPIQGLTNKISKGGNIHGQNQTGKTIDPKEIERRLFKQN